ncbi:MAG: DUF3891 family protein [Deltaproteobacteria bacterium]|nr:DUF3891 family protein [Deltaproteobacteria bacterium]
MMVSEFDESRLLLVLQIDHSRVAGFLAAHWGNKNFDPPRPFTSMVVAAQEHDSGWGEWEMKPSTLNEQGFPLDYHDGSLKYLGQFRLDFYKNAVDRVSHIDPYAGLMILMHGVGLMNAGYGRYTHPPDRSGDPRVKEYIRHQETLKSKLLDELGQRDIVREFATEDHVWLNFKLIEIFDHMAQFICNRYPFNSKARRLGPTPTLNDIPVPFGAGRGETTLKLDVLDEKRAVVQPYPFDLDPLRVSFPGRLVAKRKYASGEDFLEQFYKAERVAVSYSLQSA